MKLTDQQIAFIQQDIAARGITMKMLRDSLVDHICCMLEQRAETDFDTAYHAAIESFGAAGLKEIQQETILFIHLKRETIMKKTMFLLAYIAAMLITFGFLFKTMHWPGANVMLVSGIALLNFGALPMFLYRRYKQVAG